MWIWKTCALEKIHFHTSLETANRQNESPVSEDCSVPFPLFSDLRFSVVNDLAKLGTGRKRCRLGLGGSRTIRCSGSLPCPLQPSLQDSWLWRGIGRC